MLRMTAFQKLCEIVAKLRAPGGCPWDREQTHESLLQALIEEAYEVTEAARAKNDAHFREELGDLLLLVVMHAEIARESGRFDIDNVLQEISDKLVRRHPHVFGTSDARDSGAVLKQWEAIKREEKKADSHYLASLPKALPALMRAQKAQSKAARVNFDWTEVRDVIAKVEEELREMKDAIAKWHRYPADDSRAGSPGHEIQDEIGDVLFAVVNLARKCKIDAESALQAATDKFVARFNRVEEELRRQGKRLGDVDLAELDQIWNEIKQTPNVQRPTLKFLNWILDVGR
jgi:MazG family protein